MHYHLWHTVLMDERWKMLPQGRHFKPATDLYETEGSVFVRVEIAGTNEEDFAIVYEDGLLSISGRREDPTEKQAYLMMEVPFGEFAVQLELGSRFSIDSDKISAAYRNGFLIIELPKKNAPRRTINIE